MTNISSGEHPHVQAEVERLRPLDGEDGEVGLRVGEQEQADPAHPQHPPGDLVRAVLVRQPATDRAQHAAGQGEGGGQQGGDADVQAVLADVVLGHPQRQGDVAAEDDRVVLRVLPHLGIAQRRQLLAPGDPAVDPMGRLVVGEHPEHDGHDQHGHGVHLRHERPSERHQQRRCDELVHRRAGVAGAVDAHREALPCAREPARDVGRAHREGAAGQPDEQTEDEEMPELRSRR